MKKRLSHFPYNERSRPGWTPSTSLQKPLSPIRSTMKTVTYVPGTFVTLVPGPYTLWQRGKTLLVARHFQLILNFTPPIITGYFLTSRKRSNLIPENRYRAAAKIFSVG